MAYPELKNKAALVTGASSGIGAATAILLAASGTKVVVNYFHNEKGARETVAAIQAAGGESILLRADVRKSAECLSLVDASVRQFGPLDILINNAGSLVERLRILELNEERWDEVLALNLKSAYVCSRAVAKSMIERKSGVIINVSSIAGRNGGGPGSIHYATAKAGLLAFSKAIARELAPHGVRVNCVSPGVIATPFHERFSTAEGMRNYIASIPMGRAGTSEEVAKVIVFLCSDEASYLCGETIEINGGLLML
ncbi:MAG: SDR family NAD(P)-dependent oxidoreductase [Candidatus Acidiferrales bacterium]